MIKKILPLILVVACLNLSFTPVYAASGSKWKCPKVCSTSNAVLITTVVLLGCMGFVGMPEAVTSFLSANSTAASVASLAGDTASTVTALEAAEGAVALVPHVAQGGFCIAPSIMTTAVATVEESLIALQEMCPALNPDAAVVVPVFVAGICSRYGLCVKQVMTQATQTALAVGKTVNPLAWVKTTLARVPDFFACFASAASKAAKPLSAYVGDFLSSCRVVSVLEWLANTVEAGEELAADVFENACS